MREQGRAPTLEILLIAFFAVAAGIAQAQRPAQIDFQVVHLYGVRGSEAGNFAIRSQEQWDRYWRTGSTEPTLSGELAPPATPSTPLPKIDFKRYILLISETGVKPSSGYQNIFESVTTSRDRPGKEITLVHVIEQGRGNCPVFTALTSSVAYALIPQTTNEIRFSTSKVAKDCSLPTTPNPPFVK